MTYLKTAHHPSLRRGNSAHVRLGIGPGRPKRQVNLITCMIPIAGPRTDPSRGHQAPPYSGQRLVIAYNAPARDAADISPLSYQHARNPNQFSSRQHILPDQAFPQAWIPKLQLPGSGPPW